MAHQTAFSRTLCVYKQRKWENAKKIRRVSYQRCSPFFIIIFFTRLSISSMSCGKILLITNIWNTVAFFGLTLDSVSRACACIYTSDASPMTLSPRDAANKKPYVFPFRSPDRSTGDRLRQCRQRKNGKQKNWIIKESSVFVPGFFVLLAWRTNARICCIE